ncbi:lipopolysaccharide biosynthesis protein [Amycolatopsis thermophila]|uniref:O-antigen/teichoic acid export membrane protein n=1 Tax=Amycolatopsis thermophila TaxID=206084 RepID=A0ABU0F340_9PSEU|nr:oligosaccharide flippase family protein [Amycolatopsis thermophila]MDQ0381972.1 O-antigen/teichoic acid export membrane protein [Amycolatopsis thermophila]
MTLEKETAPGKGMVADGLALSASAAITALAGMIGWVLAARLLPAAEVGDTSAFVSGFLLIAGIAELGLGPAVLRWLPRAGSRQPKLLLRTYLVVLAGGVVGSVAFVLVPAGADVVHRVPAGVAWFLVAGIGWTLFQFQDEVLTGLGLARWVPVENTSFSVARLGLLAGLGPVAGALGLVLSWAVPTLIGVVVVTILIRRSVRRTAAAREPGVLPDRREILRLLAPSYPAMVCVVVLYNLVPLIVLHRFGAEANAVFFVVWTAINALDVAATAFVNPLVVRLSAEPDHARSLVTGAGKRLVMVFVPLLAAGALLAWVMLAIFGPEYTQGTDLLRVLLAAQVPRLAVVLGVAVHLAAGRGAGVALLQAATAASAVVLALLVPTAFGFGTGMLVAQTVIAAAVLIDLRRRLSRAARP